MTDIQENEKQDKIYWHDAFFAALQLELHDYIDILIFEDERQLSKEALAMDVLIIKKIADVKIEKNIGQIFKGHNIFEYKSEKDNLSVWDYNKVMGYAFVYSAFEEIPVEDITISFVVTPKPIKLFDYLINGRGFKITETTPGIYYIKGDTFRVQVIESKKLSKEENIFLKNLRSGLSNQDLENVLRVFIRYGSLEKVNIYLNRLLNANLSILKEGFAMLDTAVIDVIYNHFEKNETLLERFLRRDAVKDAIYKHFEKNGTLNNDAEERVKDYAVKMLKKGYPPEEIADNLDMPIEWIQSLEI